MWKKIFAFAVLLMLADVFAFGIGDNALELKTKYYNRKVFKTRFYVVDTKNQQKLKVLVFADLLGDDFPRNEMLLDNIAARKGVSVGLAARSESEIFAFMKNRPDFKYSLMFDREGMAKYMERNIILPYAFVINYQNKIIWCGELIDLPAMLDKFADNKYDIEKNRKISRKLAEMQNAMRIGSEYQLDRAARDIMEIEPGNLSCLRMRLFSFENTNRIDEAWAFLEEFKNKNPQEKNFYLLQIDMGARYPVFAQRAAAAGAALVRRNLGSDEERLLAAWMFVSSYNFSLEALQSAEALLKSVEKSFNTEKYDKNTAVNCSLFKRALALLYYKRCNLPSAIKEQRAAYEISKTENNLQILKYYEGLMAKRP